MVPAGEAGVERVSGPLDGEAKAAAAIGPIPGDEEADALEPMNVPHSTQKVRLGRFGVLQLQHSTIPADVGGGVEGDELARGLVGRGEVLGEDLGASERGGGMGAPASGRVPVADVTRESHSPQNAVSASTGAPHAGQLRVGTGQCSRQRGRT